MRPLVPATGWAANAVSHRGNTGRLIRINCPANGRLGSVWGSGPYTDDSSICTAAVHRGFISARTGGHVVAAVRPGQRSYAGTTNNGVKSASYGKWHGSFVVVSGTPHSSVSNHPGATTIRWSDNAAKFRGNHGAIHTVFCPASGTFGPVWGTSLYTDDSSICSAAVHAGVISRANGGVVTIEIRPGAPSYQPTSNNGVTSRRWARWSGSFVVQGSLLPPPSHTPPVPGSISWTTNATSHRGSNGKRVTVVCPSNTSAAGSVWGDGIYTDDSSICAAAVHAGKLGLSGGSVTIEIHPGRANYTAARRNGVTSNRWAAWRGSFIFVP